jgi:GNAT superfamily N-acetyltransferase
MLIRKATWEDAPAIVAMALAFRDHLERTTPTSDQFGTSIDTLLGCPDAHFYVATLNGLPVGYVLQRFRYSMWACGIEATIEDLFVDPSARKNGIGKALIEFALEVATDQGCSSVCLDTNEFNVASTRIYTQLGFNSMSKRWNGRQVFFRKPIQCPSLNA